MMSARARMNILVGEPFSGSVHTATAHLQMELSPHRNSPLIRIP